MGGQQIKNNNSENNNNDNEDLEKEKEAILEMIEGKTKTSIVPPSQRKEDTSPKTEDEGFDEESELKRERFRINRELEMLLQKKVPLEEEARSLKKREDKLQETLNLISKKEKEIEEKERIIEEKEKATKTEEEKETVEKTRWQIEDLRRKTEKERWEWDKEKEKLEEQIRKIDLETEKILTAENQLKQEIREIEEKEEQIRLRKEKSRIANILEILLRKKAPLEEEKKQLEEREGKLGALFGAILKEEKEIEEKERIVEEREKLATLAKEKQEIEKARWQIEDDRRKIEKEKWRQNQEIKKIRLQLKELGFNFQKILDKEAQARAKLREIERALKPIVGQKITEPPKVKEKIPVEEGPIEKPIPEKPKPEVPLPQKEEKEKITAEMAKEGEEKKKQEAWIQKLKEEEKQKSLARIKSEEEAKKREFLLEKEIRTMAKDIAKLQGREFKEEKEKIISLKPEEREIPEIEIPQPPPPPQPIKPKVEERPLTIPLIYRVPPKRPSAILITIRKILIIGLILTTWAIIGTFWYWLLKVKNKPSPSPQVTPTLSPSPPEQSQPFQFPTPLIQPEATRILEINNSQDLKNGLSQLLPESASLPQSTFLVLFLKDVPNRKILGLEDFLNTFEVKTPAGFYDKVENDFTLFIFSSKFGPKLGFIAKVKQGVDEKALAQEIKQWEASLEKDTEKLFSVLGKTKPALVKSFRQAKNFRYLTFTTKDFGICYSIYNNFFIFTTSSEAMQKTLTLIK